MKHWGLILILLAGVSAFAGDPPGTTPAKPKPTRDFFNLTGEHFTPTGFLNGRSSTLFSMPTLDDDNAIQTVSLVGHIGPLLDMQLTPPPMSMFRANPITERLIHAGMKVSLDENTQLEAGFMMSGWYADGSFNPRVSDALLKFKPGEVFNNTGYSTVFGFTTKLTRNLSFGVMYGAQPKASGIRLLSIQPEDQEIRLTAHLSFGSRAR